MPMPMVDPRSVAAQRETEQLLSGSITYTHTRADSSVVEQLFRKFPALCAVLPRVAGMYKPAQLSAERARGFSV